MFNESPLYFNQILSLVFKFLPDVFFDSNNKMTKYLVLNIFEKLITFVQPIQLESFYSDRKFI